MPHLAKMPVMTAADRIQIKDSLRKELLYLAGEQCPICHRQLRLEDDESEKSKHITDVAHIYPVSEEGERAGQGPRLPGRDHAGLADHRAGSPHRGRCGSGRPARGTGQVAIRARSHGSALNTGKCGRTLATASMTASAFGRSSRQEYCHKTSIHWHIDSVLHARNDLSCWDRKPLSLRYPVAPLRLNQHAVPGRSTGADGRQPRPFGIKEKERAGGRTAGRGGHPVRTAPQHTNLRRGRNAGGPSCHSPITGSVSRLDLGRPVLGQLRNPVTDTDPAVLRCPDLTGVESSRPVNVSFSFRTEAEGGVAGLGLGTAAESCHRSARPCP